MKHAIAFFALLLLFALWFNPLFAQTFFHTYNTSGNKTGGAAVTLSPDGNLFVGGTVSDSALVMKLDQSGNVLWTLAFKPAGVTNPLYVTSLSITSDNYLMGTAVTLDPSNFFPDNGCYFKMDLNGNVQYCRVITGLSHRFSIRRILELTPSSYIIVAAHEPSSGTYQDPMCIKINGQTGNVVSESPRYDFGNLYIDDISESILSPDKKYIYSTGRLYVNGATPGQMRVFVTKFDTTGDLLWTNYYIYPQAATSRLYGESLIYENDTLVIDYVGDNDGTSSNFEMGMLKVDTGGTMLWSKHYNITSSTFERPFQIFKTTAGYSLVGFETGTTKNLMTMSVTHEGEVLWCKAFGTTDLDEYNFLAFGSLPAAIQNDTIIITGAQQLTTTSFAMVVVKHDPEGNVDCLPEQTLDVTTTLNPTNTNPRTITAVEDSVHFQTVDFFSTPDIPNPCASYVHFLGNDTSFCSGNLTLSTGISGAQLFHWQNGATTPTFLTNTSGTYSVTVSVNCCVVSDTVVVQTGAALANSQSVSVCAGDSVVVGNSVYSSSGTFSDTLQTSFGCDSIVTVIVSVHPLPTLSVTPSDSVCNGASLQLTASGALNFTWQPSPALSCTGCSSPVASPTVTSDFIVTGTDVNGCSRKDTVTLTVLPVPAVNPETATVQCGAPIALVVNPQDAYTYVWSPASGLSDTLSAAPLANPTANTTYTLTATAANGCHTTANLSVNVLGTNVSVFYDWSLCAGDTLSVGSSLHTVAGTYIDTLNTVLGCDSVMHITLTVDTVPVVHAAGPVVACSGTLDILSASGASTYLWQPGSGLGCDHCAVTSVLLSSTAVYTVTGTDAKGCSSDTTIKVVVVPSPVISIADPPMILCNGGVTIVNGSSTLYSYLWSPPDGLSNPTAPSPFANPATTTVYTVVAADSMGCRTEAQVEVAVYQGGSIAIPNAFSPNDDGLNDLFRLITICPIKLEYFKVFNRWGELLFQTADIDQGWDGLYKDVKCEIGVYVYVVSGSMPNGERVFLKGNVSLLR